MRNLTIKRAKSFVACLAKMKVYIEDPTSNEITINHTPCRKIGDLKNGEEKTFPIDGHAAKVFVIADTLSKDFCNEYYQLPDGQEDVFLSGKNKYNPANGNAFRFDNNDSEETAANRRRGTRRGLLVLIAAVIVGAVIGYLIVGAVNGYLVAPGLFSGKKPENKMFSSDGMTMTLTDEFAEINSENYTVAYGSEKAAVFALKEPFTLADGFENNTLEQYADLVIQANNLSSAETKTVDGLTGFVYDVGNEETNDAYRFFSYVYKTDDAFWLVQFVTASQNVEAYTAQITKWAGLVTFSD